MALVTPTLETQRLVLRPFTTADLDDLYALQSDPKVTRYWDAPAWTERSRADRFLAFCQSMADEDTGVRVAVERRDDRKFLGWCTIFEWNPTFRSATLGYSYIVDSWGQGIATEAAHALVEWAFDTLNLNRIEAETDTRNLPSARVLEKLGFVREGTLREDCIVNGEISDSWIFGLLHRDWERPRAL